MAYTLKFMHKAMQSDFIVPKLEGLWWFDKARYQVLSMREAPLKIPRSEWQYRLLLRLPDFVNQKSVTVAIKKAIDKKKSRLVQDVVVFEMNEGKCVQVLHKGPFDTEPETLEKLELFIKENKLNMNGWHHEIYLSDFRKTPPEKLKTILREPVI